MRPRLFLCLALSYGSAVVRACAGHGEVREWSQEELDELEKKWGTEVRDLIFFISPFCNTD